MVYVMMAFWMVEWIVLPIFVVVFGQGTSLKNGVQYTFMIHADSWTLGKPALRTKLRI